MKNIFKYSPGFLAGVILSSAFAGAAAANSNLITNTIDELWVFVAGDPVIASEVNENFEYLDLGIVENESRITDLESWPLLGSWSCQLSGDLSDNFVMEFSNTGGHYTFSPFTVADIPFSDIRYVDRYDNYERPRQPLWTRDESSFFLQSDFNQLYPGGGIYEYTLNVIGRLDVSTNVLHADYYVQQWIEEEWNQGYQIIATGTCVATKL